MYNRSCAYMNFVKQKIQARSESADPGRSDHHKPIHDAIVGKRRNIQCVNMSWVNPDGRRTHFSTKMATYFGVKWLLQTSCCESWDSIPHTAMFFVHEYVVGCLSLFHIACVYVLSAGTGCWETNQVACNLQLGISKITSIRFGILNLIRRFPTKRTLYRLWKTSNNHDRFK